jgi:hypothetical protein
LVRSGLGLGTRDRELVLGGLLGALSLFGLAGSAGFAFWLRPDRAREPAPLLPGNREVGQGLGHQVCATGVMGMLEAKDGLMDDRPLKTPLTFIVALLFHGILELCHLTIFAFSFKNGEFITLTCVNSMVTCEI